jgi:hypothetical protein
MSLRNAGSVSLILEYEAVLTRSEQHLREAAALFGIRAAVPGQVWRKIRSEYEKE